MGVLYSKGLGVPLDETEAVKWYQLAADQGYVNAQVRMGLAYDQGRGVSQNYLWAVHRAVGLAADSLRTSDFISSPNCGLPRLLPLVL